MRILCLMVVCAIFVCGQDEQSASAPPDAPRTPPPIVVSLQRPIKVAQLHALTDGTTVALRLVTEISSKESHAGDVVDFVLEHDLWSGDLLVAKAGTPAEAVIVEASKAKWASRGAKLAIEIKGLRLLNGQLIPLRGTPTYRGSDVGPAGQVGGSLVGQALGGADYCPICEVVFIPATLVSLAAPGRNKTVKADTIAAAWVDGNWVLDPATFRPFQPNAGSAKVVIVRGWYGAIYSRDLYCNGVPLAHLPARRKLEIEVQPGWYRFAINPKKPPLEVYVAASNETKLITDSNSVYPVNEPDAKSSSQSVFSPGRSANTTALSPFARHKTEREYLEAAKLIEATDRYPGECKPLAEEAGER